MERKSAPVLPPPSLSNPNTFLLDLFGVVPASSGVNVTPHSAMRCTAVRCAVQAISEAIGQLPVNTYVEAEDGTRTRLARHPVQTLLDDAANEWTPSSELREQLTRDAILHGDGVAFINRAPSGKPLELIRFLPDTVTIDAIPGGYEPVYRVSGETIPRANVLHIRGPNSNPGAPSFKGEGIVSQAREAIGLAIVLEQHAARLFANGAKPSGILSLDGNPTPDAFEKARAAWKAAHGGQNSGGTAVIPSSATWSQMTLSSVDAQFLELRQFAIVDIARAFRVPPTLLMELGRATWSNSEEMGRQFVTLCLMPWIRRWEGEIALKLFTLEERATHYAEISVDDFLRADLAARAEAYSKLVAARILNPNEVRQLENRAPYEGGNEFVNPNTSTGTNAPEPANA